MQEVGGRLLPVGPPRMSSVAAAPDLRNLAVLQELYIRLRTPSKPDPTDPVQRKQHASWHGPHKVCARASMCVHALWGPEQVAHVVCVCICGA